MKTREGSSAASVRAGGRLLLFLLLSALCLPLPSSKADSPARQGSKAHLRANIVNMSAQADPVSQSPEAAPAGIFLAYPKERSTISAPSTFLVGCCPAGSSLSCQGIPVKLNANGFFAHVVNLKPGVNNITLERDGAGTTGRRITVIRDRPPEPLPTSPLRFAPDSLEPAADMGLMPGDILGLAVRASPGARLDVLLGKHKVSLRSPAGGGKRQPDDPGINRGLMTTYGKSYQRFPAHQPDLYTGFYRVTADDRWQNLRPKFVLSRGRRSVQLLAKARLTSVEQPRLARTVHDETVVRLGPGQARTTPVSAGVRLLVDGWLGDSLRCSLAPGRHVWIARDDLSFEEEAGQAPAAAVRAVNVERERYGARIVIPLSQRLPYQVEQQMKPNRLVLRIYGATADTDWITQAPPPGGTDLVDTVTWKQPGEGTYELTVNLAANRQWGFFVSYEGTSLVLHIKGPPQLQDDKGPLGGLIVCLDPGHGGEETGSIGPSGWRESAVNLAIALRLEELLKEKGATVTMTRHSEEEGPSLADRVEMATRARADLLISIHNNALPDGMDPISEHGTSSYWYHPQALELARSLKRALTAGIGFPDFGTFYQNLALARPSAMLATLVEVGFMINPDEYAELINPDFQRRVAASLSQGVSEYLAQTLKAEQSAPRVESETPAKGVQRQRE